MIAGMSVGVYLKKKTFVAIAESVIKLRNNRNTKSKFLL